MIMIMYIYDYSYIKCWISQQKHASIWVGWNTLGWNPFTQLIYVEMLFFDIAQ